MADCECGLCRCRRAAHRAEEALEAANARIDALGEAKEALRDAAQTQAGELIGTRRRIHELEEANRQLAHEHRYLTRRVVELVDEVAALKARVTDGG